MDGQENIIGNIMFDIHYKDMITNKDIENILIDLGFCNKEVPGYIITKDWDGVERILVRLTKKETIIIYLTIKFISIIAYNQKDLIKEIKIPRSEIRRLESFISYSILNDSFYDMIGVLNKEKGC